MSICYEHSLLIPDDNENWRLSFCALILKISVSVAMLISHPQYDWELIASWTLLVGGEKSRETFNFESKK